VSTIGDGRFTSVTPNASAADARRLPGLVLPGFANAHSHAFHRALRGRAHGSGGDFWGWREGMYAVANRLDPDAYLTLAGAAYAEMALCGVTGVGEFHYLHHARGGARYDDPNAMAEALRAAAADAGVRLTLLDACYLAGGLDEGGHTALSEPQLPFADVDVDGWAARCTCTSPSSPPRTTRAGPCTGAPRRRCCSGPAYWVRARPRCTPPT
jgi:cytosine/adenosine deaminase-related metal-dependent hydrolase